ncbi:hypothetical protein D9M72_343480 [compost metagenome]
MAGRCGVRAELAFHHAAVRGEPFERGADDGDAESQPGRGFRCGEGPVGAGVAGDEVAQGVGDRFDERQRHPHGQGHPDGVPQAGSVLHGRKALDAADIHPECAVGPLQGG